MRLDGIACRKSKVYGWRHGDPARDVDEDGQPVESNYIVIVRIKDCPVVQKDGREFYDPKDAPQVVRLAYGGTYYGYGPEKVVRNGAGRWVMVNRDGKTFPEWMCSYVKTPVYFVRKGTVYVGACYREIKEGDK